MHSVKIVYGEQCQEPNSVLSSSATCQLKVM